MDRWRHTAKQAEYAAAFKAALAAADPDYVPEPDDWLDGAKDVAEEAANPPRPPCLIVRCWGLAKRGYRAVTQRTAVGYYVHSAALERQQFGRRLRLSAECLARIARVPPPPEPEEEEEEGEGGAYYAEGEDDEMSGANGLVYFAESLPGATTIYDDDLSHPTRKAKMRPEHRHLSMHHREPIAGKKQQPAAEAVVHAEHHSFEVQEHEHELAKKNGSHAKAVYPSLAGGGGGAGAERERRGGEDTLGGRPQLPPLRNPPRRPMNP